MGSTHHEEQAERVSEHGQIAVLAHQGFLDLEATRGEDNADRDPETTVRGQSSGTKSVANSHFPVESR